MLALFALVWFVLLVFGNVWVRLRLCCIGNSVVYNLRVCRPILCLLVYLFGI